MELCPLEICESNASVRKTYVGSLEGSRQQLWYNLMVTQIEKQPLRVFTSSEVKNLLRFSVTLQLLTFFNFTIFFLA